MDLRLCKLRHARWTSVVEGVGGGGFWEVDDGVPHGSKTQPTTVRLPWKNHHVDGILVGFFWHFPMPMFVYRRVFGRFCLKSC